jgi:hypothetical protein
MMNLLRTRATPQPGLEGFLFFDRAQLAGVKSR